MAAKEIVNSSTNDVEPVVNRWLMDYYFTLALEFFQKEQYADFLGIRHVLDSVLVRPLEVTDSTQIKIRVLQFLSRINEGESLDVSFESDQISPLESALILLEHINKEFIIPQQDFEKICTSLKELIVVIFIKNDEFDKAEKVLNKHFLKAMVGKKAIFMGLIRKKIKVHEVIEQMNFKQFKEEMLAFCKRICLFTVPFLHKAATMCIEKRCSEPDYKATDQDEEEESGPSCSRQINTKFTLCKQITIPISRLRAAYADLAAGSDVKSFAQLDKEVKREEQAKTCHSLLLPPTLTKGLNQDSEKDVSFQRDSDSPMEASPADQPSQMNADPQTQVGTLTKASSVPRKRRLYTVARLVVEPDSQGSSQCTVASQEMEREVRTEEPPQAAITPNKKDLQNPVTENEVSIPTPTYPRRSSRNCSRNSSKSNKSSLDDEEEESPSYGKTPGKKPHKQPPSELLSKKSSISPPARLSDCRTRAQFQTQVTRRGNSTRSKELSSDSEEESQTPFKTPVQKHCKQLSTNPHNKDPGDADEVCVTDSSLDSSPNPFPLHPVPQTSSTPHKDFAQGKGPSLKWKQLFKNAQESKETWNDEESFVPSIKGLHNESTISNSGHRKRRWTESETQKLKEGVEKFGEGNWSKIKAYYSFKDRTNVNLKDRWRTMKKLNIV